VQLDAWNWEDAVYKMDAGIHFRTDNEVALELGKKVADKIIEKVKMDGAGEIMFAQK
jgi:hypothetical protein